MAIELDNLGMTIRITNGSSIRDVVKLQIKEIAIIKTNIIKIDIGGGALRNIFLPFSQITNPVMPDIEQLLSTLSSWVLYSGLATEERQAAIAGGMGPINASLGNVNNELFKLNNNRLNAPLAIDDRGNGTIYKGFTAPGIGQDEPYWAIQRSRTIGTITILNWADGLTSLSRVWDQRESYDYF